MDRQEACMREIERHMSRMLVTLDSQFGLMGDAWDGYDPEWWEDRAWNLLDTMVGVRALLVSHLETFAEYKEKV